MISILVKKGYTPQIAGKPSQEVETLKKPHSVALLPEKIPFIKPRLKVKVGDKVNIGSTVFEDKRNPDIKFLLVFLTAGTATTANELAAVFSDLAFTYPELEHAPNRVRINIEMQRSILQTNLSMRLNIGFDVT